MGYALAGAKKVGVHRCFLESSVEGLGLYEKLGFKPLFKNIIYGMKSWVFFILLQAPVLSKDFHKAFHMSNENPKINAVDHSLRYKLKLQALKITQ